MKFEKKEMLCLRCMKNYCIVEVNEFGLAQQFVRCSECLAPPKIENIYCDIVGDLFHVGHLSLFEQARNVDLNKVPCLIVGIHSDKAVFSYKNRYPIIPEQDRYKIIENCKLVDKIIKDAPLKVTEEFIKKHNIDIVVHGDDNKYEEYYKIPIEMGIMKYVPYYGKVSTTDLILKCKRRA